MSTLGWIATVVAAFGAGGVLASRRRNKPSETKTLTRLDAHLAGSDGSPLRRDIDISLARQDAESDLETLDRILADVLELMQADECIFWRWNPARESLAPAAWAPAGPRPVHFNVAEWAPLVRWSVEQRAVQRTEVDGRIAFAAAPITAEKRVVGALTVSGANGLPWDREGAQEWLPRFARQVGSVVELLDVRREYARHNRQGAALLGAVQAFQAHLTADALANAICETSIEVTSASGAALVRWMADEQRGTVQAAVGLTGLNAGDVIGADSTTGKACWAGLPLVLADARSETKDVSPFAPSGLPGPRGSLGVVPIRRGHQVIAAIYVEAKEAGQIGAYEAQNLGLVGAVTRGSLEIAWEIEDVTHRSRTDALTGLWNRRYFDEQLKRVIAETDRFGNSCSLIIADIDHFKQVNDTHGHETGDAVLKHVASTIREGVRAIDTLARYGGEEFAILLPQTSAKGAAELAERLRARLEATPTTVQGSSVPATASFGVATYPEPVPYGDWLFPAADKALYEAKDAGRNCVKVISPSDVTTKLYKRHI